MDAKKPRLVLSFLLGLFLSGLGGVMVMVAQSF
jgi:hypothetical protein